MPPSTIVTPPINNKSSLPRRLALTQRRNLVDLQLATRLEFLESRLDAFAQRALGLSTEITTTSPSTWPCPDPQKPLTPQESLELCRIAGEYQRIRALFAIQKVQAAGAIAAGEIEGDPSNKSNDPLRCPALSDLSSVVLREQRILTEIPMLSLGAVGIWGNYCLDSSVSKSIYESASNLHRMNCEFVAKQKRLDSSNKISLNSEMVDENKIVSMKGESFNRIINYEIPSNEIHSSIDQPHLISGSLDKSPGEFLALY